MISDLILKQAAQAEAERLKRINDSWNAYYGTLPQPLRATKSDPQAKDNIVLNFAQPIVDKGVSFLLGKDLEFEIDTGRDGDADEDDDEEDADDESPGEQWLEKCWKQNKKMTLLHKVAINGAVTGDVFLRMQLPKPGQQFPRVINLDPATVLPIWDMDDYEEVLAYRIQWNAIDPTTGKPVVRRQMIEQEGTRWRITDTISKGDSNVWVPIGPPQVWPYPWAPIFHCQNLPAPNTYWGISDIEQHVLSVNNALNFVISNMARILRIHAHPKTWGAGFTSKELQIGVDEVIVLPNIQAKLQNLEMNSDLGSTLELYKRLKEALHEITRVPEIATGKVDNIGALSGVALQILYQSLLEKNNTKQLFYGEMFEDLNSRLLEAGGQGVEQNILIQWPNPLPKDAFTEAQTAVLLDQVGVSKDTILTNMGYDADQEAQKKAQESQTAAELGDQLLSKFDKGQLDGKNGQNQNGGGSETSPIGDTD